jgi:hypothetical protein
VALTLLGVDCRGGSSPRVPPVTQPTPTPAPVSTPTPGNAVLEALPALSGWVTWEPVRYLRFQSA